ncbi:methylated-DNA--[protein]-cysteine S-methyltransferase [Ornithinimicrobium cryptoxanthini]|uniref:Methylated-DNA--protein-cysteine methyltransferase n=1 Tax=Ornithinimicrobium cryptoxanthini TaxID=2934161 RepID=A0ABY4YJN5_9MICO|nr:methylated-DNA--[protein]-cysteine S-methyltransferase [Ornithinimicrobium cryptoxanthini]USQ76725.1 methylated-DNA--[protein]-cysteine S-methyltransferase [Ornithinimicrobium cryptoxanthini]
MSAPVTGGSAHSTTESPIGTLTLVTDGDALTGLYMESHRHAPDPQSWGPSRAPAESAPVVRAAISQLSAYFRGELTHFDLALAPSGTLFQKQVWEQLLRIPYGETASYGELAALLGNPGASRAVGLANGRNPISIIVPCHRVVGAAGQLTGYGGGLERKQVLLALEQRVAGHSLW